MPIYKMDGKRDGLQQYRVRINYIDGSGKPRQIDRVAYGKDAAKQLEAKLTAETNDQAPMIRCTVSELCSDYLSAKTLSVRATTLDKSKEVLEHHILPRIGGIRLDALTPQKLQKWKNDIGCLDLTITTKRNIYKELNSLLNWGVKMERLPRNPLKSVGTFQDVYFEKPAETLHYYTPEEYVRFAAAARSSEEWPYYVFFSIAFYTGMRKGEINALRWSDINGNILHVRRSIAQKLKGEDKDMETPPKNKSSYRDLQIPLPLMEILAEHKSRQQSDSRWTEDYRVCGGASILRDTSIENKNKAYQTAAGLPHIRIHDFRHTHASLLVNEGISIQEVARRLGHSNVEITWNTYSHLYPREEERAVAILNRIV